MNITRANKSDLKDILDLQYLAYQSEAKLCGNPHIPPLTQTLEDIAEEFSNGIFLKIELDGNIIASVRAYSDSNTLYIGKLIVHPNHQGHGLGTKLLLEIERVCPHERYELFTSSKSEQNLTLYERLGYTAFMEREVSDDLKFIYLKKISQV